MKSKVCITVVIVHAAIAAALRAAEPQPSPKPADTKTRPWTQYPPRIIPLKHADSQYVAAAVSGLYDDVGIRPIERPNGLIFQGSDQSYALATKLIAELDAPDESAADAAETRMLPVLNRRVQELAGEIIQVFDRRGVRVAADRDRNVLIVRGPKAYIEQVQTLLAKLDTPTPTATVEFAFFLTGGDESKLNAPIPTDLAEVAKELERFGRLRLLGRFSTVVSEGEKFKIEGGIYADFRATIEGTLESSSPDGAERIAMKANVDLLRRLPPAKDQSARFEPRSGYTIATTTIVHRGNFTAIGVAPSGDDIGQTGILVMQVR